MWKREANLSKADIKIHRIKSSIIISLSILVIAIHISMSAFVLLLNTYRSSTDVSKLIISLILSWLGNANLDESVEFTPK